MKNWRIFNGFAMVSNNSNNNNLPTDLKFESDENYFWHIAEVWASKLLQILITQGSSWQDPTLAVVVEVHLMLIICTRTLSEPVKITHIMMEAEEKELKEGGGGGGGGISQFCNCIV